MKKADIGLIGLAVMGENLVMNMAGKGFTVAVYNRTVEKVHSFVQGRGKGKPIIGTSTIAELTDALKKPRKVMLMVRAGQAVDQMIEDLLPYLEPGDLIIDGGNSYYKDTIRRCSYVESKGLLYIGVGVSGGEEGALKGPSMMPGGTEDAWPLVQPIFQTICAKAEGGAPCCNWVGDTGAGHFVKMVHNGIEYGDMQLICEAYHIMRDMLNMAPAEMQKVFAAWNKTELDSYLIEITANILSYKDTDGAPLIDKILDVAGQKGTGKWTGVAALEEGVPLTLIAEAVFARSLSAGKEARARAAQRYGRPMVRHYSGERAAFLERLRQALFSAKIISYAQGFALLRSAAATYGWKLDCGQIALMWRGGCIIRSVFLGKIKEAFDRNSDLENLILDDYFMERLKAMLPAWRSVVAEVVGAGLPIPTMSSGLNYFEGYTSSFLPANLLQAQRDYFGAHTYERLDRPRGEFFHTDWTGHGGATSASTYQA